VVAKLIDGNAIAKAIKDEVKSQLQQLKDKFEKEPLLVAVQVGENPASKVYIRNQRKACDEVGVKYDLVELPQDVDEKGLIEKIKDLNDDNEVTGIILQLPLPGHINQRKVQHEISPRKDVEGITPSNLGMLVYSQMKPLVAPCTALAVLECLKSTGVELKGKETVIVGHSEIVGKPVLLMLLSSLFESVTPTVCHIATKDLRSHTLKAEILIVAVGKAGLIKGDMVKEGVIVIDVGINRIPVLDENGRQVIDEKTGKPKMKIVGDVVFEEVSEKASYITPVPGGVGAVTTCMLMKNLLNLFKLQLGEPIEGYKLI